MGDGTFTVKGMDGGTTTVTTSSETELSVTKDAGVSDLKVGDTIVAMGETKDGVLTATSIREGAMGGGSSAVAVASPAGRTVRTATADRRGRARRSDRRSWARAKEV